VKRHFTSRTFRHALDDRLRNEASKQHLPVETLRRRLLNERFLARLFARTDAPWLLKGGYSFELRYGPKARTTRDIDLSVVASGEGSLEERLAIVREELQEAAKLDLGDFLKFTIGTARALLAGAPRGGARFPVDVHLADKEYGRLQLDIGFGDALIGAPEDLLGEDLLAFAGVAPARVRAISKAQQFAEKVHAYTQPWIDRENTRVKDLVDLLILIERGNLERAELNAALRLTFSTRKRHALPVDLPDPPQRWSDEFRELAEEADVTPLELSHASERLRAFWREVTTGGRA
jgi:hypothetical protein